MKGFEPLSDAKMRWLRTVMDDDKILWQCPYCGERDVALHRIRSHPEMWIGGSRAYGSDFHGWADH